MEAFVNSGPFVCKENTMPKSPDMVVTLTPSEALRLAREIITVSIDDKPNGFHIAFRCKDGTTGVNVSSVKPCDKP